MPISRPKIRVRTRQIIVKKQTTDPFVGYENTTDLPDGFVFDIKRWCSTFDLRLPALPRLSDSSSQGVSAPEYFLSGVGDVDQGDLEVLEFNELFENNERHWIPLIRSGHYYRYNTPFYYYSDDSNVQYVDTSENIDSRNVVLLDTEPNQNTPITAATYVRDLQSGAVDYLIRINQRYAFSGLYTDGVEDETVSSLGKINWDNVDYDKKEFITDHTIAEETHLRFNRDFTRHYGLTPLVLQDLAACQILGMSNGSNYQVFYLSHFPIVSSSFKLYVTDTTGTTWTTWTQADSWFDLNNTAPSVGVNRYYLDKDLGIVYFASAVENSAPPLGAYLVCEYDTTVRVEYEEEGDDLLLNAWDADVSPVSQYVNQGFVCITHQQIEPAYIKLSIDKQPIPFTNPKLFGPITAGADYALLKATVTSYDGTPVPGIEITFTMDPSNVGYLDGSSTSMGLTNGSGEAFTSYQPPVSADDLGVYLTNVSGLSPKVRPSTNGSYLTHKDVILPTNSVDFIGEEANIYIYQVLKDDLLLGYDNVSNYIDANMTSPPWVVVPDTWQNGTAYSIGDYIKSTDNNTYQCTTDGTSGGTEPTWDTDKGDTTTDNTVVWTKVDGTPTEITWKNEVSTEYDLKDWYEVNTAAGIKPDGTIDGRKVVIYEFDAAAINPVVDTNEYPEPYPPPVTGAMVPVRPLVAEVITDVSDDYYGYTRLIYHEDSIPNPEPANSSNNVAGYWVVSSKIVNFQANCWSSLYNRYIYSNKIPARISLPDHLLGEYINDQLEKIPFGWKLITDSDNVAAGLNGATFLTINPHTGPYKIIDLVNEIANTDWASAPFKSVAFQVDV